VVLICIEDWNTKTEETWQGKTRARWLTKKFKPPRMLKLAVKGENQRSILLVHAVL